MNADGSNQTRLTNDATGGARALLGSIKSTADQFDYDPQPGSATLTPIARSCGGVDDTPFVAERSGNS